MVVIFLTRIPADLPIDGLETQVMSHSALSVFHINNPSLQLESRNPSTCEHEKKKVKTRYATVFIFYIGPRPCRFQGLGVQIQMSKELCMSTRVENDGGCKENFNNS